MEFIAPMVLEGTHASLVPLDRAHCAGLAAAAADGELWRLWYTAVPRPDEMEAEIGRRLALKTNGTSQPFAVRDAASGDWVGMTSYLNVDAANRRVEIGATWYAQRAQRTPVNSQCKLLLLTHAFDALDCIAVEFRTHAMNLGSRRAIERLGAKQDGVLRNHRILSDGSLRDTAVYSVVRDEWPAVRNGLLFRLGGL